MQIKEYVGHILSSISANPHVESQSISCQERPPDAAYLSGSLIFIDGSKLYIKEFILFDTAGARVVKYGYNYFDKDGNLIFRYDNALDPKARELHTYPEHRHGEEGLSSSQETAFRISLGGNLRAGETAPQSMIHVPLLLPSGTARIETQGAAP